MHKCFLGLIAVFLVANEETNCQISNPTVNTRYGQILGNRKLYDGKFYEEYLSIPFAAAPVDELRWEKPQPVEPWEPEVWNGTEFSMHCTQFIAPFYKLILMGARSGEDCLYLNIWVPKGVSANNGRKLPVMVWVYGGGFIIGTGEMYPGHALALHGDVIVVNFNYRISTLGFLSTGDSAIPGNYGLWDTKAALEWVRDNIDSFNGDPDQVTIFGQSAGGCIVSHAIISPHTNRLFKNAIAVSGAATSSFGTSQQPLRTARLIANVANCSAQSTQDIRTCLSNIGPHTLDFWGIVVNVLYEDRPPSIFPVVDGDFVARPPRESFELGEGKDINFITGSGYQDAAGMTLVNPIALPRLGDKNNVAATNESLWDIMKVMFNYADNPDELISMIFGMYPGMNTDDNMTRTLETVKAQTDGIFGAPSNWEAVRHLRSGGSGATYQYQFKHRQSFLIGYPEWVNGSHLDDIYSFLGPPFMSAYRRIYLRENFDDTDKYVSDTLMDYFSNFAYTGNPNDGAFTVPVEWSPFTTFDYNYLQESPQFSMETFYDENVIDRYRFWHDFPSHVQIPPQPTFPPQGFDERMPTEEEIERGVNRVKDLLLEFVDDDDVIEELNKKIDDFVTDRKLGFPMNY